MKTFRQVFSLSRQDALSSWVAFDRFPKAGSQRRHTSILFPCSFNTSRRMAFSILLITECAPTCRGNSSALVVWPCRN